MALRAWRFATAVLVLFIPGIAAAADLPLPGPAPSAPAAYASPLPDWIVTIGGEARAIPAWPGAPTNKYQLTGVPLFIIQKPGDPPFFFGARDGFGIPILTLGQFQLGPVGKLLWPRYANQYTQLNGLGDVGWGLQLGGYAQYWVTPWLRLRGEIRQGIGSETGVTGDLFADAVVPLGQFRLSAGPRLTAQSAAALSPYFGITPTQSANSTVSGLPALPVYNVSGGIYSYGAGSQIEYFWNPQWQTHALFEYERITGSAADSPLVTMRGSPNQFTFGVGATYTFGMHPMFNLHSLW
jgi:outer membrane protein